MISFLSRFLHLGLVLGAMFLGLHVRAQETAPASPAEPPDRPAPALGSLLGLVVLADPAGIVEDGRPGVRGVDIAQADTFADPGLVARLQTVIGRPLDTELLPALRQIVAEHYADNRALLVRLILPVQEVRDGVLQILLVRARLGQLAIEGEKWFSEKSYLEALQVHAGEELDVTRIEAGINRINASAFRRVTAELAPGGELGLTDVTLRARDRIPLSLVAGYSDSGTASTGRDRVNAAITWGNAFGRGDLLGYSFGASPGTDILRSHAVTYSGALPHGHRLLLAASHAVMHSELPPPFDQTGRSTSLNLRYELPLPAWRKVTHSLALSADYKRSDSNLLFSDLPVFGSLTEVVQATLDYNGSRADRFGTTGFGASLTFSPGELTAHNDTRAFRAQRADSSARYAYVNLSLARRTRLPARFSHASSLRLQFTTDNLLGSEQLAFGGAYSLRGYEEGEVYADEGLLLRNELNLPPLSLGQGKWRGQLQGLLFWDYGYGLIRHPLAGERERYSLSSVGPAARVAFTRHLSVSFDYGWQLIDTGLNGFGRTRRGHLNASLSW